MESERPFRMMLLGGASGQGRLMFSMHHSISDGMSREYIRRDIADSLSGTTLPQRSPFQAVLSSRPKVSKDESTVYCISKAHNHVHRLISSFPHKDAYSSARLRRKTT
ncbi:hypothetical protein [Sinorhizobium arboris]|uniref:hypothetical protein n=1 Tax=Sinorhizobium arboris TaxID=76745 RepID=UPI003B00003D